MTTISNLKEGDKVYGDDYCGGQSYAVVRLCDDCDSLYYRFYDSELPVEWEGEKITEVCDVDESYCCCM